MIAGLFHGPKLAANTAGLGLFFVQTFPKY
jgi:hypothetical protein